MNTIKIINANDIKRELIIKLFNSYIKQKIYHPDFIQNFLSQLYI